MKLSERADKFAARLRPPVKQDTRSEDEKLADFHRQFNSGSTKEFLRRAKQQKDKR